MSGTKAGGAADGPRIPTGATGPEEALSGGVLSGRSCAPGPDRRAREDFVESTQPPRRAGTDP